MVETTSIGKTRLEHGKKLYSKKDSGSERRSIDLRAYISNRHRYFLAKRLFDITVSVLVLLVVFSWLFPIQNRPRSTIPGSRVSVVSYAIPIWTSFPNSSTCLQDI
jgi:lipopolysaccharide/colanic/teichoic acid biosynthesis glycosyltransferase